ncbi:MAG TPA: PAS domain-containing sensor histidine kinase [Hyphomonadaceae bacterium]|nr:PAS domain-containing sensor histidine kinase [Hyphomonadaceae bacterium]
MLSVLLAAFGGALVLKALEERQASDNAVLTQAAREAEALAGHVRAELIASKSRMEGLLLTGASLESIRRGVPFDAVAERTPPSGAWAQLADKEGVRVFAQDNQHRWVSGLKASAALMPQPLEGRSFNLASAASMPMNARFETVDFQRSAVACAPVSDAGVAACVFRPTPLFDFGDLNRVIIYTLLLAAPLLAVFGLVSTIRRLQRERDGLAASATPPAQIEASKWSSFEVAGFIGLWRWNAAKQLLIIGQEAANLVGSLRHGDMTLDEFTSMIADDDRRRVSQALEDGDPGRQINVAFQGGGRSAGKFFELIGGPAEGGFSGAILNVTDRIQAQHRSRRAEALARTALDAHPGPFAVWDSRKRLTHWNAAFARVFNLDKNVVKAGASYDFVIAELSKFVRVERPLGDDANGREMLLLSDHWIRLVDRRTASDGLITVGVDISNLKRQEAGLQKSERRLRNMVVELERAKGQAQELAEKYQEAKTRAERAAQAKGAFLGNMSHELRTPLNHINGFSEMMVNQIYGPLGDDRYQEYAEAILQAGKHLEEMINDVLDMSKIEAGKMQLAPRMIDASDAVDAAVRLVRRRAQDRQLSLVFDPDDDLPDINGDHRAIKQMTLNLLANAIKFTDPGGEIRIDMQVEGDWLVIRVKDSGIGIAPEDLPRLGQPFEQSRTPESEVRNTHGTGLGLALTKSFAEMHGGRLTIDSTVGVGTTVTIYLPVPPAPSAQHPSEHQQVGA